MMTTSNWPASLASARLSAYSRPARISSIASAPARSMLAGSNVIPSTVVTSVALGSTSPSSTSCTDTGSLSGSWPSEKVKQPCGSRSTSSTRRPLSTIAAPSEATVVVLATPPFWLATASTRISAHNALLLSPQAGGAPSSLSRSASSPARTLPILACFAAACSGCGSGARHVVGQNRSAWACTTTDCYFSATARPNGRNPASTPAVPTSS